METTRSGVNRGQTRAVAEIVPTLLAAPPHSVMKVGRRDEVAASRAKVIAVKAGATQVTIQIKSRRATMMLVTTGSEEKKRREIRDEARARNGGARVVTPQVTALTPHRPLTLTPGLLTIVAIPDTGPLGAVTAHLRVLGKRR